MIYSIHNLKHEYNGKRAVETPTLEIPEKSITGLFGPNGAGKSTLLSLLAFIEKPTSGKILYRGVEAEPFSPVSRGRITLLNQEPYLLKRTVFDNVAYGLKIRKDTDNLNQRVFEALESVGLDSKEFSGRWWHELSGGESRRVALAARLVMKPDILLLDEPTANIDAESTILIRKAVLSARQNQGTTLIISSHDQNWLYDISDTVLHMFRGKILAGNRISLIFGPWEPSTCNQYRQKNGTGIIVPIPESDKSVAVFSADSIIIRRKDETVSDKMLHFKAPLSSVSWDERKKCLYGTVHFDTVSLTGRIEAAAGSPLPGDNVLVSYLPSSVSFMI